MGSACRDGTVFHRPRRLPDAFAGGHQSKKCGAIDNKRVGGLEDQAIITAAAKSGDS
jgi:hypothetical protein